MDLDGIQRMTVGRVSQFGWFVYYSLENPMTTPIGRVLAHLGIHRGLTN
jgi:hypothetical protein